MISAQEASDLTEEMFGVIEEIINAKDDIKTINRCILKAVIEGKPHTYFEGEIDDSVFTYYEELGYFITKVLVTKADGSYSYKYMISWGYYE